MSIRIKKTVWKITKNPLIRFLFVFFRRYHGSLNKLYLERNNCFQRYSNKNIQNLSEKKIKREMLVSLYKYGSDFEEYFLYDFLNIDKQNRKNYITSNNRYYLYTVLNDFKLEHIFYNKNETFNAFKEYFKRDQFFIYQDASLKDFLIFTSNKNKVIFKPKNLSSGRGVEIIDLGNHNPEMLFNNLKLKGEGVLEDLIIQDDLMASFHPESVNTLRIPTIICRKNSVDNITIFHPIMRVGKNKMIVDNGGAGGILLAIDSINGSIISDGYDEDGVVYESHPDTNIKFKGFQVPKWGEAIKLVKELARKFPDARYVGWDLALNNRKEWVLVEVNMSGEFKVLQIPLKMGLYNELKKYL